MSAVAERLWARVERAAEDECWPWTGWRRTDGHGQIKGDGRKLLGTHRVAWESTFGPIPVGMCVLHRCDNPPCCNPGHLFLGTQADNMRDMVAKGRSVRALGLANPRARLSFAQVVEIRARRSNGETSPAIAADYGITAGYVRSLALMSWRVNA